MTVRGATLELVAVTQVTDGGAPEVLHRRRETDGGWSPQTVLPFVVTGNRLELASWAPDRFDLAWRGNCQNMTDVVCQAFWANGAFSPAYALGQPAAFTEVVDLVAPAPDRLGVVAQSTTTSFALTTWNGGAWSGWSAPNTGGTLRAATSSSVGRSLGNGSLQYVLFTLDSAQPPAALYLNRNEGVQTTWSTPQPAPASAAGWTPPFHVVRSVLPGGGWLAHYAIEQGRLWRRQGDLTAFSSVDSHGVQPFFVGLSDCDGSSVLEACLGTAPPDNFWVLLFDGVNATSVPVPPFE
jgi:hypothetical protein